MAFDRLIKLSPGGNLKVPATSRGGMGRANRSSPIARLRWPSLNSNFYGSLMFWCTWVRLSSFLHYELSTT